MPRKRKPKKKAVFPLPEMLADGPWKVTEGLPMVDIVDRHMSVPVEDTPAAAYARAHEMVHVKITPPIAPLEQCRKHGISMIAFQAVEDMRVHAFMKQCNLPRPVITPRSEIEQLVLSNCTATAQDIKKLAALLVSIENCTEQQRLFREAIEKYLPSTKATSVIRAAALTAKFFREKRVKSRRLDILSTYDGFEALTAPTAQFFDSLFPDNDDGNEQDMPYDHYRALCNNPHVEWGELEPVCRPQLSQPKMKKGSGQKIWRDEGVVPTAIYRMTIDNRVFSRKKRVNGGTVLIDASGSMCFSNENLADVVAAAPGATVAVYAGSEYTGRLVIAAKNGRMATVELIQKELTPPDSDHPMCGNIVDGPALRWLAKQPGPRIWVSDGLVTGKEDAYGANLMAETAQILKTGDIDRIVDWREIIEVLR